MTPRILLGTLLRCGVVYYLAGGWGIGVLAWLVYFGRREPRLDWLALAPVRAVEAAAE